MYESIEEIAVHIGAAEETIDRAFKSDRIFNRFDDGDKVELVDDVTVSANALGDTIIFGIQEIEEADRTIAGSLGPIINGEINKDRIAQIISLVLTLYSKNIIGCYPCWARWEYLC